MNISEWARRKLKEDYFLLKNFMALCLIQATNFIIPLITFPYLVRTIGTEKFGVISYSLTILTYIITFADYGFNLSGTRLVAIHRDNTDILSQLFTKIMATKLALLAFSLLILAILSIVIPPIHEEIQVYISGFLYVIGNVLMPVWFFQGIEKMSPIINANLLSKLIQLCLLFIFVKSKPDYIYVLAVYGLGNIISAWYSIFLAVKEHKLRLFMPTINNILEQLRYSWYFFTSTFAITVLNGANIIIIGFFVSAEDIGYYSIVEKIIFIIWLLLGLFSQAIYPTVCKLSEDSFQKLCRFLHRIVTPFIITITLLCLGIYAYSNDVILLITGNYNVKMVTLLRMMIVVPFIVALNIPAYQILLAYNYKQEYATLFNIAAIVNLITCILLVHIWGVTGAAVCMIIIQTVITVSLYVLMFLKSKTIAKFY